MKTNLYHELMRETISTPSQVQRGSEANTHTTLCCMEAESSVRTPRVTLASRIERALWKLARWCGF